MKRPYALLILGIATGAIAQPTLQADALLAATGSVYVLNSDIYQEPATGGADQTWDFSGLFIGGSASVSYVDPATTLFGGLYVDPTVASSTSTGEVRYMSSNGVSGLLEHGFASEPNDFNYPWSDPLQLLPVSADYLDTWADNYGGSTTFQGMDFQRSGDVTGVYDAWGTLIMPYGIFENVARLHLDIHYTDVTIGGAGEYVETYYRYFIPNVPEPAVSTLRTVQIISGGGESLVNSGLTWLAEVNTGVPAAAAEPSFAMFPNPAHERCTVNAPAGARVELFDAQGRLVSSQSMYGGTATINLRGLPSGLYSANVVDRTGGRRSSALVVE